MNRFRPGIVSLIVLAAIPMACIPIPLAEAPPYREETVGELEPGVSRADVLFTLGAPNFTHNDEGVFVYASDEAKVGYIFVLGAGAQGAAGGGVVGKRFLLVIEFNEGAEIERTDLLDLGLGTSVGHGEDIGFDEVVCTSWDLCLGRSGAELMRQY